MLSTTLCCVVFGPQQHTKRSTQAVRPHIPRALEARPPAILRPFRAEYDGLPQLEVGLGRV